MTVSPYRYGMANFKELREAAGFATQSQLAEAAGLKSPQVNRLERGGRGMTVNLANKLAPHLNISPDFLLRHFGPLESVDSSGDAGPVPVFSAADMGTGDMVVSKDPIDAVKRPWFLERAPEAYGVLVSSENMSPSIEPGDMILVDPRLPPIRGKDAIFIKHDGTHAKIGRLVRSTENAFRIEQFNPRGEVELDRQEWKSAYRVVARYSGR
ncbi:MAG: XRE family transcriptional regulator [Methylocystis sp.]